MQYYVDKPRVFEKKAERKTGKFWKILKNKEKYLLLANSYTKM